MSLDYIFYDESLRDGFIAFVAERGIRSRVRPDRMEGWIVELPSDLAADVGREIEDHYDLLMDEQRELVDADDEPGARDLMGVTITLPDGRSQLVRLPARYARPLLNHFSSEEIQGLVGAIAESVLDPVDGPLCRSAGKPR
ncbi:MAG TPA: hypothetical protein VMB75_08865 [Rhodocyclaceae bacterium]|nr:hypothetical protein [Rhodocyclaceae bacterium]